jgi:glycosyltransferase involved in cell wall biosynthesis
MMPPVRIVIPTYNRATLVAEAIASAQAQSHDHFELIVADDGSTDGTREVVERIARQDSRVRYLEVPHGGVAAARNAALAQPGSFAYVAFLDSDDMWQPHHLSSALATLEAHPRAGMSFTRFATIDPAQFMTPAQARRRDESFQKARACGLPIGARTFELPHPAFTAALVKTQFSPLTSTVVVRTSAAAGRWFDGSLAVLEDCDFFLRIASAGHAIVFHDDVQCYVRLSGDNLTVARDLASPRVLAKCCSWLEYSRRKLRYCRTRAETAHVHREIADVAYLTGQCYAEQGQLAAARRSYGQAVYYRPNALALKGMLATMVPATVRRAPARLRRLTSGAPATRVT